MKKAFVILLIFGALSALIYSCYDPMSGFRESAFTLELDSRLPRSVDGKGTVDPKGYRARVEFYSSGVRLVVVDPHGRKMYDHMGASSWHPIHASEQNPGLKYPCYTVISIDGVKDILEHREEGPVLHLTDDPKLWESVK